MRETTTPTSSKELRIGALKAAVRDAAERTFATTRQDGRTLILDVCTDYGISFRAGATVAITDASFTAAVLQWAEQTFHHYLPQPENDYCREIDWQHERAARAIAAGQWKDVPIDQSDETLLLIADWAAEL